MRAIVAMCVLAGACFSPDPPSGLPCSSNDECPDGQTCDVIIHVCDGTAQPGEEVWLDDTAADFTATGAYLDEVAVEAGGFVGPIGSFTGGLRLTAIDTAAFTDPSTATFDTLAALPTANTAVLRTADIDYGMGRPIGLSSKDDDVTVLIEGEIQLDAAGSWRFELTANDAGFIDIAAPGTDFVRLVSTESSDIATLQVAAPGWYRIRGAFVDAAGAMSYLLRVDSPAVSGGLRDVDPNDLRARVDDLSGVVIDGFDEPFDVLLQGTSRADTIEATYGGSPSGIPVGSGTSTIRTSGQLLIDIEGDYQFEIDSKEGHRMTLDGEVLVERLGRTSSTSTTTEARHLLAGWHDFTIDVNNRGNSNNNPNLDFTIATGPVTGHVPSDHLRPIVGRGDRFATAGTQTTLAIADGASATRTISLFDQPLDFTPSDIHLAVRVNHDDLSTVGVTVDPPVGAPIQLAAVGSMTGTTSVLRDGPPIGDAGTSWRFTATDSVVDMLTGTIEFAGVTMVGSGGFQPFATSYRYESAVHDLGTVIELGAMTWSLRQPTDPSIATMQIRTCDTADACANEPWTDVAFGEVPSVPLRQFAQYGITIPTDGDVPTALDAVQLHYTTVQ